MLVAARGNSKQRPRTTRGLAVALVVALAAALWTSLANAGPNWGYNGLTSSCCVLNGIRSGIQSPGGRYHQPIFTIAGTAAYAEDLDPPYSGQIQIGMGQSGQSTSFSECGVQTLLMVYIVWKPWTTSDSDYGCVVLTTIDDALTNYRYSVMHLYNPYSDQGGWAAFLNGYMQASYSLGFAAASSAHGGAEIVGPDSGPSAGATYGCYGCNGGTLFSRSSLAYGDPAYDPSTSWTTIHTTLHRYDDSAWYWEDTPSPFTIWHTE
jgi:hypothetical protein